MCMNKLKEMQNKRLREAYKLEMLAEAELRDARKKLLIEKELNAIIYGYSIDALEAYDRLKRLFDND